MEQLYRASLYKIECTYNRLKRLSEPTYEHSQRLTKTYTEKVCLILIEECSIKGLSRDVQRHFFVYQFKHQLHL